MPFPDFEDLTDRLFATCEEAVGDSIQIKIGGAPSRGIKATVDYGEALRDFGSGKVIDNEITISILKSIVPAKPENASVTLPKVPATEFTLINVRDMGREWLCEVKRGR